MHVRVTGVVIEEDRILLLNQDTDTGRSWSLPGGKVEEGEPLADGAGAGDAGRDRSGRRAGPPAVRL